MYEYKQNKLKFKKNEKNNDDKGFWPYDDSACNF